MQLSISGHHLDITEAIKQHAEEKLSKIKHHFDHYRRSHAVRISFKM
jgi:putative sigma-54 modulation protein